MSHIFPAALKSVNMSVNSKKITFELSPEHYDMYKDIIVEEPGTQCLLALYVVGREEAGIVSAKTDANHQKKDFLKKIYAMIGEYTHRSGVKDGLIKDLLKAKLQARKIIEKSLSELDEHGAAQAVYILKIELEPSVFDYGRYKED